MQAFHNISRRKNHSKNAFWRDGMLAFWAYVCGQFALQRPQMFLWVPVFIAIGIMIYFSLNAEPNLSVALAAVVLPAGLYPLVSGKERLRLLWIFALCISVGFCAAKMRTDGVYTPILVKKMGPVQVSGVIERLEHFPGNAAVRVLLKNVEIEELALVDTPRKVRIKFKRAEGLQTGQRINALAGLNPPSPPVMPGGFDYQRYMYFQGVGAVGFGYGLPDVISERGQGKISAWFEGLRSNIALELSQRLGDRGGIASALLVAQKTGIQSADQDAMRGAGLAHMLAISGLHIGLFFGAVFFVVRLVLAGVPRFALLYPIKKYAAVAAMGAALFYMLIAGSTIPTQRAVLMTGVVFLAIMIDRTPLSMRLVAFAAIVVLLIAPEALLSASFQMSFSAVAGLVGFYSAIRPYWSALHRQSGFVRRAGLYVLGVSLTSVIATFATAPFALYHFQQLAIYSLLGNILAMPALAFLVMPLAVIFFMLYPFGLHWLVLPLMGQGIGVILSIAHFVSGLDYAVFHTYLWPISSLLVFGGAYVLFLIGRGHLRFVAVIPLVVFIFSIFNINQFDILVSSKSDLAAVLQRSGALSYSNLQKDRFARGQWAQAYGLEGQEPMKWPKEGALNDINCDEDGCRLERGGHRVSFLKDLGAFGEECAWADVLISSDPVPKCRNAMVIDRFTGWRYGGHGVLLGDGAPEIQSVRQNRGHRPWVAEMKKRYSSK